MSHWNYRVVRQDDDVFESFAIIEAHYDDSGELTSYAYVKPGGETAAELRTDLELMVAAFDKPIVDETDLPVDRSMR